MDLVTAIIFVFVKLNKYNDLECCLRVIQHLETVCYTDQIIHYYNSLADKHCFHF